MREYQSEVPTAAASTQDSAELNAHNQGDGGLQRQQSRDMLGLDRKKNKIAERPSDKSIIRVLLQPFPIIMSSPVFSRRPPKRDLAAFGRCDSILRDLPV